MFQFNDNHIFFQSGELTFQTYKDIPPTCWLLGNTSEGVSAYKMLADTLTTSSTSTHWWRAGCTWNIEEAVSWSISQSINQHIQYISVSNKSITNETNKSITNETIIQQMQWIHEWNQLINESQLTSGSIDMVKPSSYNHLMSITNDK